MDSKLIPKVISQIFEQNVLSQISSGKHPPHFFFSKKNSCLFRLKKSKFFMGNWAHHNTTSLIRESGPVGPQAPARFSLARAKKVLKANSFSQILSLSVSHFNTKFHSVFQSRKQMGKNCQKSITPSNLRNASFFLLLECESQSLQLLSGPCPPGIYPISKVMLDLGPSQVPSSARNKPNLKRVKLRFRSNKLKINKKSKVKSSFFVI